MSGLVELDDSTFERAVAESDVPVLVDFWASWCGRCRLLAPRLGALAGELDGQVSIVKVDVEASPATAERYGVQGLPTVVLIKDAEVVERFTDPIGVDDLRAAALRHGPN